MGCGVEGGQPAGNLMNRRFAIFVWGKMYDRVLPCMIVPDNTTLSVGSLNLPATNSSESLQMFPLSINIRSHDEEYHADICGGLLYARARSVIARLQTQALPSPRTGVPRLFHNNPALERCERYRERSHLRLRYLLIPSARCEPHLAP